MLKILEKILDKNKTNLNLLEIASGSGQHCHYFAKHFPNIMFQPSDCEETLLPSIKVYSDECETRNMCPPMKIDITQSYKNWGKNLYESGPYFHGANFHTDFANLTEKLDYILCINMMHISPFKCTEGLIQNSSDLLKSNGCLITYGPYANNGILQPTSNVNFDKSLRANNPEWGIRDIMEISQLAVDRKFVHEEIFDMPANNKMLLFRKV